MKGLRRLLYTGLAFFGLFLASCADSFTNVGVAPANHTPDNAYWTGSSFYINPTFTGANFAQSGVRLVFASATSVYWADSSGNAIDYITISYYGEGLISGDEPTIINGVSYSMWQYVWICTNNLQNYVYFDTNVGWNAFVPTSETYCTAIFTLPLPFYVTENQPTTSSQFTTWKAAIRATGNKPVYTFSAGSENSVTFPSTMTSIESQAFLNCPSLTTVTIPSSITEIRPMAFQGCTHLIRVNSPVYTYTTVSSGTGSNYSTSTIATYNPPVVNIPSSVKNIDFCAFANCPLITQVNLPSTINYIATNAFYHCASLTKYTLTGNSIYTLNAEGTLILTGNTTINAQGLRVISGANNIIAYMAASAAPSITIPDTVTSIGTNAFASCGNITLVTIPSLVTDVYANAFLNCASLSTVNLPLSVKHIWDYGFAYCPNLTTINYAGTQATWLDNTSTGVIKATNWRNKLSTTVGNESSSSVIRPSSINLVCSDGTLVLSYS